MESALSKNKKMKGNGQRIKEAGYEGEYIGVGSCILGYPANGFPEPIKRKADYYKIVR